MVGILGAHETGRALAGGHCGCGASVGLNAALGGNNVARGGGLDARGETISSRSCSASSVGCVRLRRGGSSVSSRLGHRSVSLLEFSRLVHIVTSVQGVLGLALGLVGRATSIDITFSDIALHEAL